MYSRVRNRRGAGITVSWVETRNDIINFFCNRTWVGGKRCLKMLICISYAQKSQKDSLDFFLLFEFKISNFDNNLPNINKRPPVYSGLESIYTLPSLIDISRVTVSFNISSTTCDNVLKL